MPTRRWLSALLIAVALALATKGGVAIARVAPGGGGGGGGTVTCKTTTTESGWKGPIFCSQVPSNFVAEAGEGTVQGNAVCMYKIDTTHTSCTISCPSGTHLSGNTCVSNSSGTGNGAPVGTAPPTSCHATSPGFQFVSCTSTCHVGNWIHDNSCGTYGSEYTGTKLTCTQGCGSTPPTSCTPTGGNTTHFLGCDGTCKSGYFDQTNSCGAVTVAKYTSTANGCTTAAYGCSAPPASCTPSGGNTTHFLGCDGTCKSGYFDQTNSCGTVTVAKYTSQANGCTTTADGCSAATPPPSGSQCPSGDTLVNGVCTPPTASCTAPQPGSVSSNGPYVTGCASPGKYATITYHSQVLWSCPGPTATTHHWTTKGTQATSDCQPVIKIDGTKPLACAAAPDTGSAWSSYTYNHCLSYLGNKVDCGPTLTYTPPTPYQVQGGQFPEPVYNPVACPVPIAVGP